MTETIYTYYKNGVNPEVIQGFYQKNALLIPKLFSN